MNFRIVWFVALAATFLFTINARAFEFEKPEIYGALDIVTDFGIENPPVESGRLRLRTFELGASTVIDSVWSAKINFGGHDEAGTMDLELHEAYVASDQVLSNTEIKAGRFYLGLGILNRSHSYDWGFTSSPKSQTTFFAKEPVADTGFEFTHHFDGSVQIELTGGVTNGWSYTHTSTAGRRPLAATHYLHPKARFLVGENQTLETGLNYLGRTDADSVQTRLVGFEFSYQVRREILNESQIQSEIQSEIYHRIQSSSALPLAEDVGGYLWGDHSLGQSPWSLGVRLDALTTLSLRNADGSKRQNLSYGATPMISYQISPASTVRTSYSYLMETREGDNPRGEQRIELQLIALIGERPTLSSADYSSTN